MKCVIDGKREAERPQCCQPCRTGLATTLRELVDAYAMLGRLEPDDARDALPAGPVRAATASAPVSGSREAPVPVSLDLVDLSLPARKGSLGPHARGVLGYDDAQIGHLSVATELDTWVRDWISYGWCPGDHLPVPTVATLAGWLSVRLDAACDRHEAIDEFAGDMRRLLRACQRAVGTDRLRIRLPAPCPTCQLVTLVRDDGADYVECTSCRRLWTEDEYARLCVVVTAELGEWAA